LILFDLYCDFLFFILFCRVEERSTFFSRDLPSSLGFLSEGPKPPRSRAEKAARRDQFNGFTGDFYLIVIIYFVFDLIILYFIFFFSFFFFSFELQDLRVVFKEKKYGKEEGQASRRGLQYDKAPFGFLSFLCFVSSPSLPTLLEKAAAGDEEEDEEDDEHDHPSRGGSEEIEVNLDDDEDSAPLKPKPKAAAAAAVAVQSPKLAVLSLLPELPKSSPKLSAQPLPLQASKLAPAAAENKTPAATEKKGAIERKDSGGKLVPKPEPAQQVRWTLTNDINSITESFVPFFFFFFFSGDSL